MPFVLRVAIAVVEFDIPEVFFDLESIGDVVPESFFEDLDGYELERELLVGYELEHELLVAQSIMERAKRCVDMPQ